MELPHLEAEADLDEVPEPVKESEVVAEVEGVRGQAAAAVAACAVAASCSLC